MPPRPLFHYRDKGMLATIGRAKAVGVVAGVKLTGFIAWLTWALVHITQLIGFRNRLMVMLQWAWAYIVFQRGARLITGKTDLELHQPRERERLAADGDQTIPDIRKRFTTAASSRSLRQ